MQIKTYDGKGNLVQVTRMAANSTLSIRNKPGRSDFCTVYLGGKDLFAEGRGVKTKQRGQELIELLLNSLNSGETECRIDF